MLRRSDFIAATYALSFVLANFGIAIAARMPMMTTTIRSSMSVKPFLLRMGGNPREKAVGLGSGIGDYGAESENTTAMLSTPGALLGWVHPSAHTVFRKPAAW